MRMLMQPSTIHTLNMLGRSNKKRIALVGTLCFLLICITNLLSEELLLRKIYLYFISNPPLYCYRMPGESLPDILESDPPKGKSIFFHETSCKSYKHKKIVIEKRQACAIESAAKLNENRSVYVLFTSPGIIRYEGTESDNLIKALLTYKNVHLLRVNFDNYTKNTPIENLYEEGYIKYSQYAQSHMSDLLRYVTLWKYGGIYLDLDVIVIRSFFNLTENFAGAESQSAVAAGVLSFDDSELGHDYAAACLYDLESNYKYDDWGNNGPGVITRLLQDLCDTKKVSEMVNKNCNGFKVYPPLTSTQSHGINGRCISKRKTAMRSSSYLSSVTRFMFGTNLVLRKGCLILQMLLTYGLLGNFALKFTKLASDISDFF